MKETHPVRIILRDWGKTKKGNSPVIAETHTKTITHVATINEYRWLYHLALNNGDYFLAEYCESLIKETES